MKDITVSIHVDCPEGFTSHEVAAIRKLTDAYTTVVGVEIGTMFGWTIGTIAAPVAPVRRRRWWQR